MDEKISIYLNDRVSTACALGLFYQEGDIYVKDKGFYGRCDKYKESLKINDKSYFDVASLTKPIVTLLSLLALKKEKKISFEDTLDSLLPEIPSDKKGITVLQLVSHFSGLPAHKPYYKKLINLNVKERKREILQLIIHENLEKRPGAEFLYSDLGYILLGSIIEESSGELLENYWKMKIADPLNVTNYFKFTQDYKKENDKLFVVTGTCPWTDKTLCGVVHDDNCRVLGCMSGHAGLFSTLEGILSITTNVFFQIVEKVRHPCINRDDLKFLLNRQRTGHWAYGFDVPSQVGSSSGQLFSRKTIGHLGYTGTSFWIDLSKKIIVVLLTNRVIYGNDNTKIKEMRRATHDAAMEAIEKRRSAIS
jgi:CubicO group peptidase (beta-lactamase class C family)